MVVAGVHDHVRLGAHVTGHAGRSLLRGVVEVVVPRREALRLVARRAHVVVGDLHLGRVGVVAVGTGDAGRVHLALEEGAPVVDLVLHLSVGVVEALLEEGRVVRLGQELPGQVVLGEQPAPRVTPRAHLVLDTELRRFLRNGDAPLHVHLPAAATPLVESHHQARVPSASRPRASASSAQATCREPGPWQASQETSISEKVVPKRSCRRAVVLAPGWWSGTRRTGSSSSARAVQCSTSRADPLPRVEVEPALPPVPAGRLSQAMPRAW